MIICLYALIVLFNAWLYIFLIHMFSHIFFPNHALNWECSKDEQSFIWKMFLNEKDGDSFLWEIISYLLFILFKTKLSIKCDSPYILYWDFLLMIKNGRSNGRLLTWENVNIVLAILFILMLCALLVIIACLIFNNNVLPIAKLLFMLFMFDYIFLSILNILLEVSKLEYFLNSKEHILRRRFLVTLVLSS